MASFKFNNGSAVMTSGGTTNVWSGSVIKGRIVLASVTPNIDATVMTGLTAVTGTVDQTLSNNAKSIQNSPTNRVRFTDNETLHYAAVPAGPAAGYWITYVDGANDGVRIPLDCAAINVTPNGSDLDVTPQTAGVSYTQQTAV